jgi:hypothetical protein
MRKVLGPWGKAESAEDHARMTKLQVTAGLGGFQIRDEPVAHA